MDDPLVGKVIQGRYRVCRVIGRGGMGVVYEAEHLLIGRKVALKMLTARASLSSACVVRFRREAQAAASVGNRHVVDVLDMGMLDDGSLYLVLEYLQGLDLRMAVAQERRLPVARAVRILCQLCEALSAVHAAGVVHRDLKPENIFLIQRDGQSDFVKVLDFGVCKIKEADGASVTVSRDTIGTPLYMAPEQVEGRRDVDHRTDIYALGAILYFLLTGSEPFAATTLPKLFLQICNDAPPSTRRTDPSVPPELDAVVQRALAKAPELRFESCGALRRALLPFMGPTASAADSRRLAELAATLPVVTAPDFMRSPPPQRGNPTLLARSRMADPRLRTTSAVSVSLLIVAAVVCAVAASSGRKDSETATIAAQAASTPRLSTNLPAKDIRAGSNLAEAPPGSAPRAPEPSTSATAQPQPTRKGPSSTVRRSVLTQGTKNPAASEGLTPESTLPESPATPPAAAPSRAASAHPPPSKVWINREPKRGL